MTGTAANSRNLDNATRTSALRTKGECEPHIAFDDVAHVATAVSRQQRAFDAHAEGEAGVPLRVDATGDQHPRVDHAAPAPFDPALRFAGTAGIRRIADRSAVAHPAT